MAVTQAKCMRNLHCYNHSNCFMMGIVYAPSRILAQMLSPSSFLYKDCLPLVSIGSASMAKKAIKNNAAAA